MRRAVLSLIAVALTVPVLIGVLRQSYSLEVAALRVGVLAVGVPVIDQLIGQALRGMTALLREAPPDAEAQP